MACLISKLLNFKVVIYLKNADRLVLVLDVVKFLGISIVGQSNKDGDGGIYVGSIMKGLESISFAVLSGEY